MFVSIVISSNFMEYNTLLNDYFGGSKLSDDRELSSESQKGTKSTRKKISVYLFSIS